MKEYTKLIDGYKHFRKEYLSKKFESYRKTASVGQHPTAMVIACSDSRINPAIITNSGLGKIFTVHNVANIVPPYSQAKGTHHSTSSAIEYAIKHINIKNIIIMGHSGCGGVKSLFADDNKKQNEDSRFIKPWINIIASAKAEVLKNMPNASRSKQLKACEQNSILISLENLKSFPFVQEALEKGNLQLHAWYFEISQSTLYEYNSKSGLFEEVI